MVFATPAARRGRPRLDTTAGLVAGVDGRPDTCSASIPHSPIDPGWWRRDHARDPGRGRADASRTWSWATSTRPPTTRRCARLADAGCRSATELANEGWQPTWPALRDASTSPGVALPRVVQIDHVLVGPRLAALGSAYADDPGDRPPGAGRGGGREVREPLTADAGGGGGGRGLLRAVRRLGAARPARLAAFMAGFARPWWIVGGWAIEAFTGAPREHEDIDLSILACDIPALREHVGDRWHLWSNHGGTLRPLNDKHPEVLDVRSQIWVRASAQRPVGHRPADHPGPGRAVDQQVHRRTTCCRSRRRPGSPTTGSATSTPRSCSSSRRVHRRPKDERDLARTLAAARTRPAGLAARRRTTRWMRTTRGSPGSQVRSEVAVGLGCRPAAPYAGRVP